MHPFFHVFSWVIPAYGFFMALGIVLAVSLFVIRVKQSGGCPENALIVSAFVFLGVLVGGSLLYLFASYGIQTFLSQIRQGDFSFFTSGGLVFYGGLIGGIAASFLGGLLAKERHISLLVNAAVPCIPLGHGVGRIGCLFAGCCYGLPYDGPFAVQLPVAGSVFPIQLAEAILDFGICAFLLQYSKKKPRGFTILYLYLILYSVVRFILEFFRGDLIRGFSQGLSVSQWISIALFTLSVILLGLQKLKIQKAA